MFSLPVKYDFLFQNCGIKLPKGLLLYGYPGCGKTYFA
jgi:peroxin-1